MYTWPHATRGVPQDPDTGYNWEKRTEITSLLFVLGGKIRLGNEPSGRKSILNSIILLTQVPNLMETTEIEKFFKTMIVMWQCIVTDRQPGHHNDINY